jgi:HAMP domain-containing protein
MSGTQVRAQSGSTEKFSAPVKDGFSTVAAADGQQFRSWAETLKSGVQLQVLVGLSDVQARHGAAVRLVDLSVLVSILVAALVSWFVTGIALRPLSRLQEGARALAPDDLGGRLPSVTEPREVADISASVNALLDRMQAAAEAAPARATGPVFVLPKTSTVTPPPAEPDTFPPRKAATPRPATPPEARSQARSQAQPEAQPEAQPAVDEAALRAALAKLGDDLDSLLDNPELSSTQRHLILASIQNEYRRIVALTSAGDAAYRE